MDNYDTLGNILQLIDNHHNILLVTHRKIDGDALGSTVALYLALQKCGKNVTAVCEDPVPEVYNFLPNTDVIKNDFMYSQDFIITLDYNDTAIEDVKYTIENNKVNIIISPKHGLLSQQQVRFMQGKNKYDLIIALDCADQAQMGKIFSDNADIFYNIPLINIDHHSSNTYFGKINLVDITAASTSQILYDLIRRLPSINQAIDEDIATLLLAGIISDTGSFQNPNTTPHSFEISAELLLLGARQQEIIKHIYKTKKLSTLKLWGKVLSKIKNDPIHRLVWSTVSWEDFASEKTAPTDAAGIIDDLLSNAPGAEIILLIQEEQDIVKGSLRSTSPQIDCIAIAKLFGGGGHVQAAGFKIEKNRPLAEIEAEIIQRIRDWQAARLQLPAPLKPAV